MNDMRWAWVLFVAASLAVLIRLTMWFLPPSVVKHSEQVTAAVEESALAPVVETSATVAVEVTWPDEPEKRPDWAPAPPPAPLVRIDLSPEPATPTPPPLWPCDTITMGRSAPPMFSPLLWPMVAATSTPTAATAL